MSSHISRINRNMITGWMIIVVVLLVTYIAEVIKGERTLMYLIVFMPVVVLPALVVLGMYIRKPDGNKICYCSVIGYFVMYIFVMMTCRTPMVSTYILPMLSLLILYHHPNLILATGGASLIVNFVSITQRFRAGILTLSNSDEAEIQIALIILCFGASYVAARLYDTITKQNENYLKMLNEQNEQIQKINMQTITAIAKSLDAKDTYTEGHSERVAAYSAQIAEAMGMSKDEIENIRLVALLHDIGKIGVPDSVLNKPGRLTDEEFALMKHHTEVGSDIVKELGMIPGVAIGARSHHERYDGRGYPDGLKGENIPYVARIIAVADAYDAMTSNRVYRKHLTKEQVVSEIEKGQGTQFDPDISGVTLQLIRKGVMKNLSPDIEREVAV